MSKTNQGVLIRGGGGGGGEHSSNVLLLLIRPLIAEKSKPRNENNRYETRSKS